MGRKRITLINCGGTISSAYEGETISAGKVADFALPGVIKTVSPFCILSENMDGALLTKLGDVTAAEIAGDCDAAVVTHGTDTLTATAAYLGLRLAGIGKPVLIVSSDFPLGDARANGRDNLALAAAAIDAGLPGGVYVPYRNPGGRAELHFATRLLPARAFDGSLFSALDKVCGRDGRDGFVQTEKVVARPVLPDFARAPRPVCGLAAGPAKNAERSEKIGGKDRTESPDKTRNRKGGGESGPEFGGGPESAEKKIRYIVPYVGFDWRALGDILRRENAAAVIEGTHSGTVKTAGQNSVRALDGLEVYLAGGLKGGKYESLKLLPPSVRAADNISPLTLYHKLRLAYAYFADADERADYLKANTFGEYF